MNPINAARHGFRKRQVVSLLLAAALGATGCASPETREASRPTQTPSPVPILESEHLAVELEGIAGTDTPGSLIRDAGWREYRLTLRNRFAGPLTIRNVRLLTSEGRYVESAGNYTELAAPPDATEKIAGNVARQGAGIAAGQVIPFGGTLVSLVTNSATALTTQKQADEKWAFALRKLKNVELAPGGRMSGSAFLPEIPNVRFLVIDYAAGGKDERLKIPFANQRTE